MPLDPVADRKDVRAIGMGAVGWAVSGGTFFDHRSAPDGSLAAYYEWDTLDYSAGHSDDQFQYHYHAVREILKS